MSSLEDIIDLPANLEVKRALAVKMILFDFKTEDICALLNRHYRKQWQDLIELK